MEVSHVASDRSAERFLALSQPNHILATTDKYNSNDHFQSVDRRCKPTYHGLPGICDLRLHRCVDAIRVRDDELPNHESTCSFGCILQHHTDMHHVSRAAVNSKLFW